MEPKTWPEPVEFVGPAGKAFLRKEHASNQYGDNLTRIQWVVGDKFGTETDDIYTSKKEALAGLARQGYKLVGPNPPVKLGLDKR